MQLARANTGIGAICMGEIAEDLLHYLQTCPSWPSAVATATASAAESNSKCGHTEEKKLAFNSEKVEIIDDSNNPTCSSPNRDRNLAVISSNRVACFLRALRTTWKPWLEGLTVQVRRRIVHSRIRKEVMESEWKSFRNESFADNALIK